MYLASSLSGDDVHTVPYVYANMNVCYLISCAYDSIVHIPEIMCVLNIICMYTILSIALLSSS